MLLIVLVVHLFHSLDCHSLFSHLPSEGHVSCFLILLISKVVLNIHLQILCEYWFSFSLINAQEGDCLAVCTPVAYQVSLKTLLD